MPKEKIQEQPKPIMFRPSAAHEKAIKALIAKMSLVDNKADAIKYFLDLGIKSHELQNK